MAIFQPIQLNTMEDKPKQTSNSPKASQSSTVVLCK